MRCRITSPHSDTPQRKVLYVLPEIQSNVPNARRTRAMHLLPALDKLVDLRVMHYGPPSNDTPDVRHLEHVPIRASSRSLIGGTLRREPRVFVRYTHPQAVAHFERMLTDMKPDIIHFDSHGTVALQPYVTGAIPAAKTVAHTHDSISLSSMRRTRSLPLSPRKLDLWLQSRKIERVERDLYPAFSLCLVDSGEDAAHIRSLNPATNVDVLPLGFNAAVFRPDGTRADLGDPAIVFTGSMSSMQSVDAALYLIREIMPIVWARIPHANVYIVGGGADQRIHDLRGDNPGRIFVTGFVEDIGAYLRAATVFVSPLRLGSGMRTRVIEAAASKCAIVSSTEGVRGIGVDTDHLPWRIADDASSFAREIVSLVDNAEHRRDLGARALGAVERRYSWPSVAGMLVQKYETLFATPR